MDVVASTNDQLQENGTLTGFIAYPANPVDLRTEICAACHVLQRQYGIPGFETWEENDIAGRFLIAPILEKITKVDLMVADVTKLNFNVAFEIGYAIGARRRAILIRRGDIQGDSDMHASLGIFDTLGYTTYTSGSDLAQIIRKAKDTFPLKLHGRHSSGRPRLFLVEPPKKTSYDISLLSAIKKSRIAFENYDPTERGRLSAVYAIECVSREDAFVARFLPNNRTDALIHNIRVSFCAGIAHALERGFLLFQESEDPVPLDFRDLVVWVPDPGDISKHVAQLVLNLYSRLNDDTASPRTQKTSLLSKLHFGSSIAENEGRALSEYYLRTEMFRQAQNGDIQVVAGRKGAGKTAFFLELRNSLRRHPQNVVLDLQPEGFQLLKFKEQCLSLLSVGTREHLLIALWEYVILLEIAFRILRDDKSSHVHNHVLNQPYHRLSQFVTKELSDGTISDEGDFSERLDRVLLHVESQLAPLREQLGAENVLTTPQVTELLYRVDLRVLRDLISAYIVHKEGLWILVDNLDKGWPTAGVTEDDTRMIRCLQAALHKIEKPLRKQDRQTRGIVFIRSDVFERLVDTTPDKGKFKGVSLDLSNRDILREILRLRIAHTLGKEDVTIEEVWPSLMVSHIQSTADESCSFLIDRSFMRPRCLLDLVQACRGNALSVGHEKVEEDDIREGLADYSTELATNIGFEIRDVWHSGEDVLFALLGCDKRISRSHLERLLSDYDVVEKEDLIELLMWYGVLGPVNSDGDARYIYDERYNMMKLRAAHRASDRSGDPLFEINPAFWSALEIDVL